MSCFLTSGSFRLPLRQMVRWKLPVPRSHLAVASLPALGCCGLLCAFLLLVHVCRPQLARAQPPVGIEFDGELDEAQRQNIRSHLSLARLPDKETLSELQFNRLLAKARKEAAKAMEPFGYYAPDIELSTRYQDGQHLVTLTIHPGPRVVVEEVTIELTGPGSEDPALHQARLRFPVRQGDFLDHQVYESGKDALLAMALDSGYQRAAFHDNRVEVRRKNATATMYLHLTTGPRYQFGPLTFVSQAIDQDLLNRIAPVHEGDPFSPKALARLRQSLFNSNYFKAVDLEYDLDRAVGTKVPVTVRLTPNLAHKYGVGLGYGTDTGARGTLEYTNRYINRYGHQLEVALQPAQRKSNLTGTYTIPIGDPKRDRLALTGKYETEQFDNTDTETVNATVSHDHFRDWGEYSTFVEFIDQHYTIGSDSDQADMIVPGLKGSIFWADDRIATKKGIRFTAAVMGSEDTLLASTSFLQATLRTKAIYAVSDQWRVLGRGEVGSTLVNDFDKLPPLLRFYAGGDQSVRGYGYKTISPTDQQGNVLGGKDLLTYSLELERTLFDTWSGAIFYDSGSVMNDFSALSFHSGAGVGLRWNGVFGQIRLDLARSLEEDGSWRIHLTMGADL